MTEQIAPERQGVRNTAAQRPRRRHAATGGRILTLGLSASAVIVLSAVMADASNAPGTTAAPVDPAPSAVTAVAAPPLVVHVVLADGRMVDSTITATPATVPAASIAAPIAVPAAAAQPSAAKITTKTKGS